MGSNNLKEHMDPSEWAAKLKLFLEIANWTQENLSDLAGVQKSTISEGKSKPVILPKHYDSIAGAMQLKREELLAEFGLFEAALLSAWRPSWKRLVSELPTRQFRQDHFRIRRAPEGARLVQTDEKNDRSDVLKIKVGQRYRISLDIMHLLKTSNIELRDDSDPISPYHLYLFQVEDNECLMLRPNAHLNPKEVKDLSDPSINNEPQWKLLVPPPAAKPDGMIFGGAPGPGDFFVLVWRRPISDKLLSDLTNPKGARLSSLDNLAKELRADSGGTPEMWNYWRMYRQPYQLIR